MRETCLKIIINENCSPPSPQAHASARFLSRTKRNRSRSSRRRQEITKRKSGQICRGARVSHSRRHRRRRPSPTRHLCRMALPMVTGSATTTTTTTLTAAAAPTTATTAIKLSQSQRRKRSNIRSSSLPSATSADRRSLRTAKLPRLVSRRHGQSRL